MGYTHYWNNPKKEVNQCDLVEIRGFIDTVLKNNSNIISYESEVLQTPELYVVWSENYINCRFNGIGEDGHETFSVSKDNFDFCKTAHKPYDTVVCQVLLIYQHFFDIDLSSDGFFNNQPKGNTYEVGDTVGLEHLDGTWGEALTSVNNLLNTNYQFVVDSVYGNRNQYFSYVLR